MLCTFCHNMALLTTSESCQVQLRPTSYLIVESLCVVNVIMTQKEGVQQAGTVPFV